MSTKKKSEVKSAAAEAKPQTESRPADLRHHGDGSGMLDAKTLAERHGQDVLDANADKARRIRAENGE